MTTGDFLMPQYYCLVEDGHTWVGTTDAQNRIKLDIPLEIGNFVSTEFNLKTKQLVVYGPKEICYRLIYNNAKRLSHDQWLYYYNKTFSNKKYGR